MTQWICCHTYHSNSENNITISVSHQKSRTMSSRTVYKSIHCGYLMTVNIREYTNMF